MRLEKWLKIRIFIALLFSIPVSRLFFWLKIRVLGIGCLKPLEATYWKHSKSGLHELTEEELAQVSSGVMSVITGPAQFDAHLIGNRNQRIVVDISKIVTD